MTSPAAPALSATAAKPVADASLLGAVKRYVARFDDGELVRWIFRGVLVGTIGVLAMDLRDLYERGDMVQLAAPLETVSPVLPPAFDTDKPLPADPRRFVTGEDEALRAPMRFVLRSGGVLLAEGAIDSAASERLAAELDQRGEYVRVVSLNSPGGALDAAIDMAKLVRDRKLDTEVADGALCASSCPLIFAGGVKRIAGAEAAIGVHQFFAAVGNGSAKPNDSAQALSDAQLTTARISRHLQDMGVEPAMWLHALDTPPQALYYFSPDELAEYRLATVVAKPRPEASARSLRTKPAT